MNILAISTGSGLFKPATGDRNRFFNLTAQLAKRNKMTVLQPLEVKDVRDPSLGKVVYFKTHIFGRSFALFTDVNPDFAIKFMKIIAPDKIDIIQVSHPLAIVASKLISLLIRRNVPVVYDAHNVDSDSIQLLQYFLKSSMPFIKKVFIRLTMFLVPIIEMVAVKFADYIIAVSEVDRTRFIQKYGIDHNKITVIPSGVDIQYFIHGKDMNKFPDISHGNKFLILFHGSFHNAPNIEAIDLIRNYLSPRCATTTEEAMLIIAGTDCPVFEEHNIKSVGFVKDIYSLIQVVDIAIVPIRNGGGTRLKILDYMGAGLPIVTTKKGIEGINAKNGEHAIIVNDVNAEFVDAIKYLINNEKERKRIGANARKLAEEQYDWNKIGEKLDKLYERIIEEGGTCK